MGLKGKGIKAAFKKLSEIPTEELLAKINAPVEPGSVSDLIQRGQCHGCNDRSNQIYALEAKIAEYQNHYAAKFVAEKVARIRELEAQLVEQKREWNAQSAAWNKDHIELVERLRKAEAGSHHSVKAHRLAECEVQRDRMKKALEQYGCRCDTDDFGVETLCTRCEGLGE